MTQTLPLSQLSLKQPARIAQIGGDGALRQHFLDMGMIPGAILTIEQRAPMGDPIELRIHGFALALRLEDAAKISVQPIGQIPAEEEIAQQPCAACEIAHPGLGEPGRYHEEQTSCANKPPKKKVSLAMVGNPNCGKTTLFNQLTGARQHVGNFPGVTVEHKDGTIIAHPEATVTDLPGIYSLSPYTAEEVVSRRYILENHPDAIINIVDANNIERNLYLTMQLMELDVPVVLALNMMDEVERNGGSIRINEMEQQLGIPVVPISALTGEGVDEVVAHAIHIARYDERPLRQDFCSAAHHGGSLHRCLHALMHLVEHRAAEAQVPLRFAASKLAEGDAIMAQTLHLDEGDEASVAHIVQQMEAHRGLDSSAAIADMRYAYIRRVCRCAVVKPRESREYARSRKIDRILTGRYTAIPSFILIMAAVFYCTFSGPGGWLQTLCEQGIDHAVQWLEHSLHSLAIAPSVSSLVVDGICGGVGTVISFLPMIIVLFFFLSLLEDSGYMARIAFVMDKMLRRVGLSGRSIVPILLGFGCSVPGIMSCRILPSERDRRLTILLIPFASCTAKIPVYALFANAFFPQHQALVMLGMYLLGIVVGVAVAAILNRTAFRGKPVPFVMELPCYRMPAMGNVARLLIEKARDFLHRAFTVIFLASIAIWCLQNFDFSLEMVDPHSADSMLAQVANFISPVFRPLGFDDWRITTSLVGGVMAKEVVVSTLGGLLGDVPLWAVLNASSAMVLMVFCLFYTPCIAAISTIRRELGGRWAAAVMCGQCVLAWCIAALVAMIIV